MTKEEVMMHQRTRACFANINWKGYKSYNFLR
uniref:Uncharacterized protein n=1 Tax=Setaria italica TaxID=4555 RepID=K3XTL3_SETIT